MILRSSSYPFLKQVDATGATVYITGRTTEPGVLVDGLGGTLADLGYLGLERLHAHSFLPVKATKHHPLSYEEKRTNRTLARLHLHIERVIGRLKVFRILAERYRGRRKRFGLRFNLISGIHNLELALNP